MRTRAERGSSPSQAGALTLSQTKIEPHHAVPQGVPRRRKSNLHCRRGSCRDDRSLGSESKQQRCERRWHGFCMAGTIQRRRRLFRQCACTRRNGGTESRANLVLRLACFVPVYLVPMSSSSGRGFWRLFLLSGSLVVCVFHERHKKFGFSGAGMVPYPALSRIP